MANHVASVPAVRVELEVEDDDDVTVVTSNTADAQRRRKFEDDLHDRPPYQDMFIGLPFHFIDHLCNIIGIDNPFDVFDDDEFGIFDSGASDHYWTQLHALRSAINLKLTEDPITVTLPDGGTTNSTHTCELDYPDLPAEVREGHVIPGITTHTLISVRKFTAAGCKVLFEDDKVRVFYKERCILTGIRHSPSGLWMVPLTRRAAQRHGLSSTEPTTPTIHRANSAYTMPTKQQAIKYMHQLMFSPALESLKRATRKGQLRTFPHINNARDIAQHLAPSPATSKGHLRRRSKGLRSTRKESNAPPPVPPPVPPVPPPVPPSSATTAPSSPQSPTECNMFCFAALADLKKGTIYTDNTGPFPVQSLDGHQLFFIAYIYDLNAIIARPLKDQKSETIYAMYQEIFEELRQKGFEPKFNVSDNLAANAIKEFLVKNNCEGQFVLPGDHRANACERAIQCWKNHFISGLCTTDSEFPLQLWPHLAPQAEDTLNLLRTSRRNPSISAYADLHGHDYDFNHHPLAPPGTKAVIHEPADSRTSWGPRGVDAWYLGSAKDHYRAYNFWVPETKSIRIAGTADFFPQHCRFRQLSPSQHAMAIAKELQCILRKLQNRQRRQVLQPLFHEYQHPQPSSNEPAQQRVDMSPSVSPSLQRVGQPPVQQSVSPSLQRVVQPPVQQSTNISTMTLADLSSIVDERVLEDELFLHNQPTPLQRVSSTPPVTTSTNPTHPRVHKKAPRTHRRITRANTPGTVPPMTSPTPPTLPRRSPRLQQQLAAVCEEPPPGPITVATPRVVINHAINIVTEQVYYNDPTIWQPRSLERAPLQQKVLPDLQHFAAPVIHPVTGEAITSMRKLMKDPVTKPRWSRALGKEVGNLCQGDDLTGEKGTDALHVMSHDEISAIPNDRVITYARIVVDYRPQKEDPYRVRITAGGNLIQTPEDVTTRTADLVTTKILWNSVLSTPDAKYACFDIKSFFLTAPLNRYEYMKMPLDIFPDHTVEQYNLKEKAKNGFIYFECRRCIYGLPQSGALANKLLRQRLAPAGYFEVPHTPGLWKHWTRPIQFSLIVDDFGVKYVGREHAEHLLSHLQQEYTVSTDWTGSLYAGISLDWNYDERTLFISMPKYIPQLLKRLKHPTPRRPTHTPQKPPPRQYGKASQNPLPDDNTPLLPKERVLRVQQVLGSVLFYARAIDNTVLVALSSTAMTQAKATETTEHHITQILDYLATHPVARVCYRASDMILNVHSDASYLNEPNGRSRVAGFFFLGSDPINNNPIQLNGAIHVACSVLKFVVSSAAEAELGALFVNCREGKIFRLILEELGHPQPATPVHCDNATATGIANDSIKKQRSRSMEMRFFWVTDQVQRKLFDVHWYPGKENLADYFTKHFEAKHHMYYLHLPHSPQTLPRALAPSVLRGCVGPLQDGYARDNPLPHVPQ